MQSSPAPPFEVGEAEFARVPYSRVRCASAVCGIDENSIGVSSGRVESRYLVGSRSPSGHSISSHSSGCGAVSFPSREAGRIRTAAKREVRVWFDRRTAR